MSFTERDNMNFWEKRAGEHPDSWRAGSNDELLVELEVATLAKHLKRAGCRQVLDIGCGNGATIRSLVKQGVKCQLSGMDFSPSMVKAAMKLSRHTFVEGDASCFNLSKKYDAAYSVRCLINLETAKKQVSALKCIANHLKPGALYYCVEPFREGVDEINRVRMQNKLEAIEMPWHNNYLSMKVIYASKTFFKVVGVEHFASTYYLASRLFNALSARQMKRNPKYRDPINLASAKMPVLGEYAPHRLVILQKTK